MRVENAASSRKAGARELSGGVSGIAQSLREEASMGELSQEILKYFSVKPKRIVKEKSYYILETDTGVKVVKKTLDGPESLRRQHAIKEFLNESGFPRTDRFSLSSTGEPFALWAGELYVMTDLLDFKHASFYLPEEFRNVVETLALMHKLTGSDQIGKPDSLDLVSECERAASDLALMKKKAGNLKRLSDFDVAFIKSYSFYQTRLKEVSAALSGAGYALMREKALSIGSLCHNSLKERTILVDGRDIFITHFSDASAGIQLWDLATAISRYGRNSKGLGLSAFQIIEAYSKTKNLTEPDIRMLHAMLNYPIQYMNAVRLFYGKKRPWLPAASLERLEFIVDGQDYYDRFVSALGGAFS
jgi:CotS family spore coat protein